MTNRDNQLQDIRPVITSITLSDSMSKEERFQNTTLRPIIKFQNDLFIEVFRYYIKKHKNVFYKLELQKRLDYISNTLHKDIQFRNTIQGMVISLFTMEEYTLYTENTSALNKRIITIVIQRLQSNIQLFETPKTA